ncbi:XRE family transcriptional regulator [Intrasporangium chromatireducens Q5-1]|uniref:XRE family transcriptional regulator n=1 Tax=Intrasporangium chromatireducens Q5-1 TaxID=584657 RepID=W9GM09_9MICO|nr:helix-turn-helix transcriptional regulator [Intrasporangium chromatireducens]EWT07296.1 XRE family transcriptional regulator [Intrasporangium chromatireducens Q5-1]
MSRRSQEARDFLVSRRAKITPEQAGLRRYGGQRRVPGLRREEVAILAGVSVDHYTRLEKGNLSGVSDSVLDAVAGALQLTEAERIYLFDLARAANAASSRRERPTAATIHPSLQRVLDAMTGAAAFVRNGRLDILATNLLGRALYSPVFDSPTRPTPAAPPNIARFHFLDPNGPDFFPDIDTSENTAVQLLRAEAGRRPHDKQLTDLIGELCTRSDNFARRWADHDVRSHRTGLKRFRHPVVGELAVSFDGMDLPADPGLTMTVYTTEPGSPDEERLRLLAVWAATELTPAPVAAPVSDPASHA